VESVRVTGEGEHRQRHSGKLTTLSVVLYATMGDI
jgi:hypothetical protein